LLHLSEIKNRFGVAGNFSRFNSRTESGGTVTADGPRRKTACGRRWFSAITVSNNNNNNILYDISPLARPRVLAVGTFNNTCVYVLIIYEWTTCCSQAIKISTKPLVFFSRASQSHFRVVSTPLLYYYYQYVFVSFSPFARSSPDRTRHYPRGRIFHSAVKHHADVINRVSAGLYIVREHDNIRTVRR